MLRRCILIGLAGVVGALARYGLASLVQRSVSGVFPWGTFAVNMLACAVAGWLFAFTEARADFSPDVRAMLFVGFLGSFSTFSTLMIDSSGMMRQAEWFSAFWNLALHLFAGLALTYGGYIVGREL